MRGRASHQSSMLCLMSPEGRVPKDHPLRPIKALADAALKRLSRTFARMYGKTGRPSIPPETLLKSMILMAMYSVRSERLFCEMLSYNLLYRWFLDMDMMEDSFHHSGFCHNRDRLLEHEVAHKFLHETVRQAQERDLMSSEHFSVDGTIIEAWASMKSFRPKDDDDSDNNGWSDFRGKKRKNDTHESKTDPDARLYRSPTPPVLRNAQRQQEWSAALLPRTAEKLLAATPGLIAKTSSTTVARRTRLPMWRRRNTPPLTAEPPGMLDIRPVRGCANASNQSSVGANPLADSERLGIEVLLRTGCTLQYRPVHTTFFVSPVSPRSQFEETSPAKRAPARCCSPTLGKRPLLKSLWRSICR